MAKMRPQRFNRCGLSAYGLFVAFLLYAEEQVAVAGVGPVFRRAEGLQLVGGLAQAVHVLKDLAAVEPGSVQAAGDGFGLCHGGAEGPGAGVELGGKAAYLGGKARLKAHIHSVAETAFGQGGLGQAPGIGADGREDVPLGHIQHGHGFDMSIPESVSCQW